MVKIWYCDKSVNTHGRIRYTFGTYLCCIIHLQFVDSSKKHHHSEANFTNGC